MVDVGGELSCALDFTFLQGTFLQGEVSLPRRGRKPEGLLVHGFGENVPTGLELARRRFSERARNQKSLPRRGRKPEWLLIHDLERTF